MTTTTTTLPSTMRCLKWSCEKASLELQTVNVPSITKPDQVIVKVAYVGVCGTDLHIQEYFGENVNKVTLGHEFCGTVAAVGDGVSRLKPHDRVAVGPLQNRCGHCRFCYRKQMHLCSKWGPKYFLGTAVDGGMAEYCIVNEVQVFLLPDTLPLKTAALCEPFANYINGLNIIGQLLHDSRILVLGAGFAGTGFAITLHMKGFRDITLTQRSEPRRKTVQALGLNLKVLHPDELAASMSCKDASEDGFDLIIDSTGSSAAIEQAFPWLCKGGMLNIYGCGSGCRPMSLPILSTVTKNNSITTTFLSNDTFADAVGLLDSHGQRYIDFEKLDIHLFDMDEHQKAFRMCNDRQIMKAVFQISKDDL